MLWPPAQNAAATCRARRDTRCSRHATWPRSPKAGLSLGADSSCDADMNRSTNMRKREAEARFPYKVDILIPAMGLGNQLTDMVIWCRENVTAGEWAQHNHSEHRKDEASIAYARFYFASETIAEAFRRQWA